MWPINLDYRPQSPVHKPEKRKSLEKKMPYQFITFERSEGVGTVTLNRPDQLNAFTPTMLHELSDVFKGMERDPLVRAIIITGAGRAFCGGENFRQRAETELTGAPPAFEAFSSNLSNPPTFGGASAPYN